MLGGRAVAATAWIGKGSDLKLVETVAEKRQTEPRQGSISLMTTRHIKESRPSRRTAEVRHRFGLASGTDLEIVIGKGELTFNPGSIVLLLGPSGSGKSTLLERIRHRFPSARPVHEASFPNGIAILDRIAPSSTLTEAIALLTACGAGEPRLWLRSFDQLSEGERFRVRLARAVADSNPQNHSALLLCDEFCSGLHRRIAKAVSFTLRKLVRQRRLSLVVASSNDDIVTDLQPDTIVRLDAGGACHVESRTITKRKAFSLRRRLVIDRGSKRDYTAFASMHYRASDELGFVDKVFTMRDGRHGQRLGIVVYSHAPLELALRNQATDGFFTRNPKRLNRCLRILRRLVVHPDIRGCGVGHFLVRKTLPQVGTPFVECLAGMGNFNPVFEKAGMQRIGECDLPQRSRKALAELSAMNVTPSSRDFASQVGRRPDVRRIVSQAVADWYAATTGGGDRRVPRQSAQQLAQQFRGLVGSRPVYYLWRRGKKS